MGTAGRITAFLMVASLVVAGCGGDGLTEVVDDDLTPQESLEIFGELMEAIFAGVGSTASARLPDGLAAATQTFTTTSSCPLGGAVSQTITVTDNLNDNGTGTITYSAVQTPNDCSVETSSGTYEVNGAPNLTWGGSIQFTDGEPSDDFTWTLTGGYDFTGTKNGVCQVDLTYEFNIQTGSGTMTGTMCGNQFNQTF